MTLQTIRERLLNLDEDLANGAPKETLRADLAATVEMVDGLIRDQDKSPAAKQLGRLGGTATAKRGPEYFRELAARRKTHGGGRPRKEAV
jgi:hypothetical protein